MPAAEWDIEKEKLEEECTLLEDTIARLSEELKSAERSRKAALRDELERDRALLCGKEICLQHVELSILIRERKKAKERNPLFW